MQEEALKDFPVRWERYPSVADNTRAHSWLTIQYQLGLSSNTIDAYGRALEDFLRFGKQRSICAVTANREHIASYVHDLLRRPSPRGGNVKLFDSGAGLANATLQQKLTAIRLFYDFLIEEGLRNDNPVGRGRYTPRLYICHTCLQRPWQKHGLR